MHEFWTIPTTNICDVYMIDYTNMVVDEHEIQTLKVMVVVLLLCYFIVVV